MLPDSTLPFTIANTEGIAIQCSHCGRMMELGKIRYELHHHFLGTCVDELTLHMVFYSFKYQCYSMAVYVSDDFVRLPIIKNGKLQLIKHDMLDDSINIGIEAKIKAPLPKKFIESNMPTEKQINNLQRFCSTHFTTNVIVPL